MEAKPMNPVDETPVTIEAPESTSAPDNLGLNLNEHAAAEDLERASDQHRPVEELRNLLLRISHHLDYETSERSTIYYRLLALDAQGKKIENQTKRRVFRAMFRYLVVICLAIAGTLAWQSYGDAAKQIIATRGPELGWSPQSKAMIASWVDQLGWTKPPADAETTTVRSPAAAAPQPIAVVQTVPETAEPKAAAVPSVDPEQVQQIMRGVTTLQQTVEQLATAQDQMARQITSLQANDLEMLKRVPAPAPAPLPHPAPAHKPAPPTSLRAPAPGH
jgi:hypothetical protein